MRIYNNDSRRGYDCERVVIQALQAAGFDCKKSSKEEDMFLDIDVWVNGTAVSIKNQRIAETSRFIQMECYVKCAFISLRGIGSTDTRDYVYRWQSSWFHSGEAEVYLIHTGEGVLHVVKSALVDAVESGLVETRQINGNRWETVQKQMKAGHFHHDAKSVIISLDDILREEVGYYLDLNLSPLQYVEPKEIGGLV